MPITPPVANPVAKRPAVFAIGSRRKGHAAGALLRRPVRTTLQLYSSESDGAEFGKGGGLARTARMTPGRRAEIAKIAARA